MRIWISATCLSKSRAMKVLFGMALRQTAGFVESLLGLIGLDWSVPDFSTLSRRQRTLKVNITYRGSQEPLHLLIPLSAASCGCASRATEGEGAWNARKHGGTKRRVWRRIHIPCPAVHVYMHGRGHPWRCRDHFASQKRQTMEAPHRRSRVETNPPGILLRNTLPGSGCTAWNCWANA